jgi:hypothetical protein
MSAFIDLANNFVMFWLQVSGVLQYSFTTQFYLPWAWTTISCQVSSARTR